MVNAILAKRGNHIVAKGGNPVWPKGSKSRGFSSHVELEAVLCLHPVGKHHLVAIHSFQSPVFEFINDLVSKQRFADDILPDELDYFVFHNDVHLFILTDAKLVIPDRRARVAEAFR